MLAALVTWLRARPARAPNTDEAMRAHGDYLDALVADGTLEGPRPARPVRTEPPTDRRASSRDGYAARVARLPSSIEQIPGGAAFAALSRRVRTLIVAGVLFVVLFVLALTLPVPYVILSPGPTYNTLGTDDARQRRSS